MPSEKSKTASEEFHDLLNRFELDYTTQTMADPRKTLCKIHRKNPQRSNHKSGVCIHQFILDRDDDRNLQLAEQLNYIAIAEAIS